jgi:hypothetical protein
MLLLHFVADFTLQGCLANLKQKSFWIAECKKYGVDFEKYKYDYITGLGCHSMYWTLLTFAPLLWLCESTNVCAFIILINTAIHAVIDDLKANRFKITLYQDQLLHFVQIFLTFSIVWGTK